MANTAGHRRTVLALLRACEGPTCGHCGRGLMLTRGLDWCPQHQCHCGHARGAHDQGRWDTDCVECTSCTGFIPARSARQLTNQGELFMLKNALRAGRFLPDVSWLYATAAVVGIILLLVSDGPGLVRFAGTALAVGGLCLGVRHDAMLPIEQPADVQGGAR